MCETDSGNINMLKEGSENTIVYRKANGQVSRMMPKYTTHFLRQIIAIHFALLATTPTTTVKDQTSLPTIPFPTTSPVQLYSLNYSTTNLSTSDRPAVP